MNKISSRKNESPFEKSIHFVESIGIEVCFEQVNENSFLPGIYIKEGKLIIDEEKLQNAGDLLHEAGHIAVAPPANRLTLNDDVTANRPGSEGEEIAVLLWSYAACLHLDLPAEFVFHKNGYKGESEWLLNNFNNANYIGLPLLVWMGMAKKQDDPGGFPKMIKWIRE